MVLRLQGVYMEIEENEWPLRLLWAAAQDQAKGGGCTEQDEKREKTDWSRKVGEKDGADFLEWKWNVAHTEIYIT